MWKALRSIAAEARGADEERLKALLAQGNATQLSGQPQSKWAEQFGSYRFYLEPDELEGSVVVAKDLLGGRTYLYYPLSRLVALRFRSAAEAEGLRATYFEFLDGRLNQNQLSCLGMALPLVGAPGGWQNPTNGNMPLLNVSHLLDRKATRYRNLGWVGSFLPDAEAVERAVGLAARSGDWHDGVTKSVSRLPVERSPTVSALVREYSFPSEIRFYTGFLFFTWGGWPKEELAEAMRRRQELFERHCRRLVESGQAPMTAADLAQKLRAADDEERLALLRRFDRLGPVLPGGGSPMNIALAVLDSESFVRLAQRLPKFDPTVADGVLGRTPMHVAAEHGRVAAIEYLSQRSPASVNTPDKYFGRTPLIVALYWRQTAGALKLLEKGADPSVTDKSGNTVLHWAVYRDNLDIIKQMLQRNVAADAREDSGLTALDIAARLDRNEAAKLLLERPEVRKELIRKVPTGSGDAADEASERRAGGLTIAFHRGNTAMVRLLLDAGAVVPQSLLFDALWETSDEAALVLLRGMDPKGWASVKGVLDWCVKRRRYRCAEFILKNGYDVKKKASEVTSALMEAIRDHNRKMFALLLDCDIDVERRNENGWTPLHSAAMSYNTWPVELLLRAGANLEVGGSVDGRTALHYAIQSRSWDNVELMLAAGADPTHRDKAGLTAADHAKRAGKTAEYEQAVKRAAQRGKEKKPEHPPAE